MNAEKEHMIVQIVFRFVLTLRAALHVHVQEVSPEMEGTVPVSCMSFFRYSKMES